MMKLHKYFEFSPTSKIQTSIKAADQKTSQKPDMANNSMKATMVQKSIVCVHIVQDHVDVKYFTGNINS